MQIEIPRRVWIDAERTLRECGRRACECVLYLCGTTDGSHANVSAAYHPAHTGSAVGYEVPIPELTKMNSWLFERRLSVFAQVHTHPGSAFHSATDDRWPTIETVGFLSLVVPNFAALGLAGLDGCYLAEYEGCGRWREIKREEMLTRVRLEM